MRAQLDTSHRYSSDWIQGFETHLAFLSWFLPIVTFRSRVSFNYKWSWSKLSIYIAHTFGLFRNLKEKTHLFSSTILNILTLLALSLQLATSEFSALIRPLDRSDPDHLTTGYKLGSNIDAGALFASGGAFLLSGSRCQCQFRGILRWANFSEGNHPDCSLSSRPTVWDQPRPSP